MRAAIGWLRVRLAGFFSRLMRTRFARRFFLPYIAPVQLWLYRRTGGRFQLSSLLLPSLVLVTTGAKSGLRRETPLMCLPRPDGAYLVAGSNWGQEHHPAWSANLLAHPDAEILVRRKSAPGACPAAQGRGTGGRVGTARGAVPRLPRVRDASAAADPDLQPPTAHLIGFETIAG